MSKKIEHIFFDHWGDVRVAWIAFIGAVMIAVIVVGAVIVGRDLDHNLGVRECHTFGRESRREVQFVDYSYWSWDCLTPSSDGKWISTTLLIENTGN